jgi:hypothetical protein
MFVLATLMGLLDSMAGTPYSHGYSPAGTDCSGLASLVSNVASDRPAWSERFNTGNEESALLARGFKYGTAPGALVIGWNGGHTAVTLPDGTPVSPGGWRCTRGCPGAGTVPGEHDCARAGRSAASRAGRSAASRAGRSPAGRRLGHFPFSHQLKKRS